MAKEKRKDTCCTARWVAVSGLCDSLSSVRICLSPSSCGCHAIFIVFFNSTTSNTSAQPAFSLTSQINGSSPRLSSPSRFSAKQALASFRTVLCKGAPRPSSDAAWGLPGAPLSLPPPQIPLFRVDPCSHV